MKEKLIKLNGVETFTKQLGTGKSPLVVIHGGPDWDHSFLVSPFVKYYKSLPVLFFDIRGCGKSTRFGDPSKYSIDNIVIDLFHLLEHESIEAVDLLGFSFGGRVALKFSEQYPEKINSLILASTFIGKSIQNFENDDVTIFMKEKNIPDMIDTFMRKDFSSLEKTKFLAYSQLPMDIYNQDKLLEIRAVINKINFSGEWVSAFEAGLLKFGNADYSKWLTEQNFPTLILHGSHDRRFAEPKIEQTKNICKVILNECGHLCHLESPKVWCNAIHSFLTKVRQKD